MQLVGSRAEGTQSVNVLPSPWTLDWNASQLWNSIHAGMRLLIMLNANCILKIAQHLLSI